MKNINKALSIALSVLLILSVASVAVSAAEYTGKCGENVTYFFDESTGKLKISGEGAMYDYYIDTSPFVSFKKIIKSVYVGEGVTSVGKYSLDNFDELEEVVIENNFVTIGERAFSYCDKLTSINIICKSVSTLGGVELGYDSFRGCSKLVNINLPEGVTKIDSYAFYNCVNLKTLGIPKSVKTLGYNFAPFTTIIKYAGTSTEWMALRENDGKTGSMKYYTFSCQDKIVYPSGNCGNNVTWEINPLDNCVIISGEGKISDYTSDSRPLNLYWRNRITKIIINEGIEAIGDFAFCDFETVTSISLPDSVTTIGISAFDGCGIADITIPNSVATIGNGAFKNCNNLKYISIPNSVTEIGVGAFASCKSLSTVMFGDGLKTIGKSAFRDCDSLTSIIIPDSVETIGYRAFSNCESLSRVTIGDGVKTIENYAFYECKNLSKISVGEAVEIIGYLTFRECNPNATIYVHNNITDDISIAVDVKYPITIYYSGTEEEFDNHFGAVSFNINPSLKVYCNAHIHKWNNEITPPTCEDRGYVKQTCKTCGEVEEYYSGEPIGECHNYIQATIPPTCTKHGVTNYNCEICESSYWEYSANPTGHTLNEDGVCEVCGEKEVSTSPVNTQMLSIESVFAMIISLWAKLFGIFSVV